MIDKQICPVCEKRLLPDEDIVVCPSCGARYHRACYNEKGACIYEELHGTPQLEEAVSQPITEEEPPKVKEPSVTCPRCGQENLSSATFCSRCSYPLKLDEIPPREESAPFTGPEQKRGIFNQPQPGIGFPGFFVRTPTEEELKEEIEGVTVKELALYVGPNAMTYLPRFKLMSMRRGGFSINWSAFFLNFGYFLYRKMYLIGGILLGLFLITMIPSVLVGLYYMTEMFPELSIGISFTDQVLKWIFIADNVGWAMRVTTMLFFGFFGNRIYLNRAVKDIKTIRAQNLTQDESELAIMKKGGVNRKVVITLLIIFLVLYLLAYLLPLYL